MTRGPWFSAALVFSMLTSCGRPPREAPPAVAAPPVELSDAANRTPAAPGTRRVIWLGLDAADWDYFGKLALAGKIPNWKRLSEEGLGVRLESFEPMLSPILWTTQETGVGPDVHRVLDFQEVDPETRSLVPVSERSRKIPAIWNVVSRQGGKVGVVGFWATHPAEIVNGFFLSNRIAASDSAQIPGGVGSPPSLDETVRRVVGRDGKVSAGDLASYLNLPAGEIEASLARKEGYANPISALADLIGTTRVTQRLARELYDRERPELLAVYFEGTDSIGHLFGRYAAPRLSCVPDAEFAAFERVPATFFEMVDRMLGQWMRRAREDGAILVVTSDHGFRWGDDRPCDRNGTAEATAAAWHRSPGVFLAWGNGVAAHRPSSSATQFDVAPTLLALLGAPVDPRLRGKVIPVVSGLAAERREVLSGIVVSTVAAQKLDPKAADENARKLVALGYISPSAGAAQGVVKSSAGLTKSALNNLGVYFRFTAGDEPRAREAWTEALRLDPSYTSPLLNLARLAKDRGDNTEASHLLLRAAASDLLNAESTVERWAAEFEKSDRPAATRLLRDAHLAHPNSELYRRDYALILARGNRCREAVDIIAPLERSASIESVNAAAAVEVCLDRPDRVRDLLTRSLTLDPNQPRVRDALSSIPR